MLLEHFVKFNIEFFENDSKVNDNNAWVQNAIINEKHIQKDIEGTDFLEFFVGHVKEGPQPEEKGEEVRSIVHKRAKDTQPSEPSEVSHVEGEFKCETDAVCPLGEAENRVGH